jgi:hypothetical protein
MTSRKLSANVLTFGLICSLVLELSGCATLNSMNTMNFSGTGTEKTQVAYEKAGNDWGKKLKSPPQKRPATNLSNDYTRSICEYVTKKDIEKVDAADIFKKNNITNNDIDVEFVYAIYSQLKLDYFNVHSELKDSFKKGFRLGYEDRIADLVLGPHLTVTAACVGMNTSQNFVDVINAFENGWVRTLHGAIDTFIVLISEGSQADRDIFVKEFVNIYNEKFKNTEDVKAGKRMKQISAGGTVLYVDMSKDAASAALDIPSPDSLKAELYKQTFKVMGDELGRRYATNLIKRDELVDLLRRIKPVLNEVGSSDENLSIIRDAFVEQYKADGQSLFSGILADAGYEIAHPSTGGQRKKK